MLIASKRHSNKDLQLWHELAVADSQLPVRSDMIDKAVASIRQFGCPCYCGVSWGKDSVVIAHLCLQADPAIPLIHLRPTNHNPDCDAVRDDYLSRFPGQTYSEVPVDYSNLHAKRLTPETHDKLTDYLWCAAIRESGKPFNGRHILGIRANESPSRALRCKIWGVNSPNGCAPLAWWKTRHIFSYLSTCELPIHPAYACLGGGRWNREHIRVAELGDSHGKRMGRAEWEHEYYFSELNRLEAFKDDQHAERCETE